MARIIYGALAESIRGSIGGTTFQRNAYGYTVKRKPNMINPAHSTQVRQQIYFARAVREWSALTVAHRNSWISFASTFPQYAKHNPGSQLSGFALFTKIHVWRFMFNQIVLVAPLMSLYGPDPVTIKIILAAGVLTISPNYTVGAEDYNALYSLSRPFGAAQNFIGTRCRFVIGGTSVDDPKVITTLYTALYGALPAVGDRIAVDLQLFGEGNGQIAAKQSLIIAVTAT